ncbi:MAG: hypothetical protein RQ751_09865 [Longimicrobiales bacterium]|nr:hypothetical protein [Longimicrobiales bacterium]
MPGTVTFALWLPLAAGAGAYAWWCYFRRETPVRGRTGMALLRAASLALLLLLLLDPALPGREGAGVEWTLLDVSPSMDVPQGPEGETPRHRSGVTAPGERSGDPPPSKPVTGTSDPAAIPFGGALGEGSRLAPALARALERGAPAVHVVTDLRLDDPVEVEALLRQAAVPVRFDDLGGPVVNAGVAGLTLPAWGRAGEEVEAEVQVFGTAPDPVAVTVEVRVEGGARWDTLVAPGSGGERRIPLRIRLPDAPGPVALRARVVVPGDAHPGDDALTRVVQVGPPPGAIVLVSWQPDWEPRFLLGVLAEVTGLPARGFLRVGPDRFLTTDGGEVMSAAEVAVELEEARLAVVHRPPAEPGPAFARALERTPRLLRLPRTDGPDAGRGEWYLAPGLPPSPVAGELAGLPLAGLPPLSGVIREGEANTPVLLLVPPAGDDADARPALLLYDTPGGRRAEARAGGFWRWAIREGPSRELYRRLWSGVAAWLLSDGIAPVRDVGLAPVEPVVAPGAPVAWRAGPAAAGTLRVRLASGDPAVPPPAEARLSVDSLGRAAQPAPTAPGLYRWEAEVLTGPAPGTAATGILVVEAHDVDLLPVRALHLAEVAQAASAPSSAPARRPLRGHPAPYLLLLGLLAAEWVARRRSGLR